MDKKIVFAVIAIVVIAGIALAFYSSLPKRTLPSPSPTIYASVTSSVSASPDANVEQEWSMITNPNVEKACLIQAKREAEARGYSESLVFSCGCTPQEASERKSYECNVNALDGGHPARVICTKSMRSCEITTEFGTVYYTFDQLRVMFRS